MSAPSAPPLHVAVTGATGLLGRALVSHLVAGGHRVTCLVRRPPGPGEVRWDPAERRLDGAQLEGIDAAVHLAGENIAVRWTDARRRRIRESRVAGTRLLSETLARLHRPPRVLVSASGVGIYGNRGDESLTEESPPGDARAFLVEVARAWEAATASAQEAGIRVVRLRLGIVLSPTGGALRKMLPAFRLGVGGRLGSGRQWMSWIALEDAIGVIAHSLAVERLAGPVNAVAPHPVTNREFTTTLGRVLGRPTLLAVPAPALRLVFGRMADEALLASARALPVRLQATGYQFRHPRLEPALRHLLRRV